MKIASGVYLSVQKAFDEGVHKTKLRKINGYGTGIEICSYI